MQSTHRRSRGFTLVEIMVTMALFVVLLGLGVPAFATFILNAKVKNAAETSLAGLNLARGEAVSRNAVVRFQMVTDLTSSCANSSTALAWVVSLDSAAGACNIDPSATTTPRIVQKQAGLEGTDSISVSATGGSGVAFNGLGRIVTGTSLPTPFTQIDFTSAQGVCEHTSASGTVRCLRILLSTSGQAKLCDPKVAATTDPRYCS
jgi:type IV fimbrial biogenesis protein FimT